VNITPGLNGMGHFFMAVDYGIFGDKAAIKAAMSKYLQELRESKKAEGQERIFTHGEKAAQLMAARINGQIPMSVKTIADIKGLAAGQGVPWTLE
jgi:LDH2 family malate/lactate/ureidoglycolate dehydrogenase